MNSDYTLEDLELFDSAARTNAIILSLVFGAACGLVLWLSTYILLVRGGEHLGGHLSLLSVFFPGYSVSIAGAWAGFLWGFVIGSIAGAFVYWTYARSVRTQLLERVLKPDPGAKFMPRATLLLSGNQLGMAFGLLFGLQIFAATSWLVLRGTAENSAHANLLTYYLPGYDVSFVGGLIGAVEIFILLFAASHVLSAAYNTIARRRHQWDQK